MGCPISYIYRFSKSRSTKNFSIQVNFFLIPTNTKRNKKIGLKIHARNHLTKKNHIDKRSEKNQKIAKKRVSFV
jgi:hypothetical protein